MREPAQQLAMRPDLIPFRRANARLLRAIFLLSRFLACRRSVGKVSAKRMETCQAFHGNRIVTPEDADQECRVIHPIGPDQAIHSLTGAFASFRGWLMMSTRDGPGWSMAALSAPSSSSGFSTFQAFTPKASATAA